MYFRLDDVLASSDKGLLAADRRGRSHDPHPHEKRHITPNYSSMNSQKGPKTKKILEPSKFSVNAT